MQYSKNILLLVATLTITVMTAMAAMPRHSYQSLIFAGQQTADRNHYPVVIYTSPEPTDTAQRTLRQARSSRYDKPGAEPIRKLPAGIEELPINAHWWLGLPALPTFESDAVVLGEIVKAEAHLSNDKTRVYSEFTIHIEEVLKDASRTSPTSFGVVTAEREGGAVQFPSGHIQLYSIAEQGMPHIRGRYLFFLKYNEQGQDFSILTGYELRKGRVVLLDGTNGKLPFADYKGRNEGDFLHAVRDSIKQHVQALPQRGGQN